jgi:cytosine/adenosine deaminase-related metal-dependent hydrolase
MHSEGIDECVVDHTHVLPNDEDLSYDWIEHFISTLPGLRNMHAHGSDALYPAIGQTFEIVAELINQLFPKCSENAVRAC